MPDGGVPSVLSELRPRRRDGRSREARSERVARMEVAARLRDIAKELEFELHIPGRHYSGGTNDDVLEWRRAEGRDFAKDTPALRRKILTALLLEFEGETTQPSGQVIRKVVSDVILEHVVMRVESGGGDLTLPPLTPEYRRAKTRAGYGGKPIGVRTARWLMALEKGRVTVTF